IDKSPEVVALEYHVDYWDDLVYGAAGVWKDPFSDAAYTKRQRTYNQFPLKGKRGVYTPQMIVDGQTAAVGSRRNPVGRALNKSSAPLKLDTSVEQNVVSVDISGRSSARAQVWLAVFDKLQTTDVLRGENHGKTMRNHHVVRQLKSIADWRDGGGSVSVDVPELANTNVGCAIFVQDAKNGQILGAEYCQPVH
ncbi:MAG: DUF1223 domain-containing protein, partial [Pseudomonadota bacterium]